MSAYYSVEVQSIEAPTTVLLDIRVVHGDTMFIDETPGFALMMLVEAAPDDSPLATEIDEDLSMDREWMQQYAAGFVRDIELIELENEPPPEALDNRREPDVHEYWDNPEEWLRGTLRIEVSDGAWVSHLSAGQSWESMAFEPLRGHRTTLGDYASCDPITFEESDDSPQTADDSRAGLLPVPRIFYPGHFGAFEDELVWVPKYTEKAYVPGQKYAGEDLTEDILDAHVGDVVFYSSYGDGIGVLTPEYQAVKIDSRTVSAKLVSPGKHEIQPARFNEHEQRLGEPVTIPDLIDQHLTRPAVVRADVDGATVSLHICAFESPGYDLGVEHAGHALAFVATSEAERFNPFENAESRLGAALHDTAQTHELPSEGAIYERCAHGLVTDWTLQEISHGEAVDWGALSHEEIAEKLRDEPWPTWRLDVTFTHPEFVEHIPATTPYALGNEARNVREPANWEDAPLAPPSD